MEPDLSRSLTLHPHPFHLHRHPSPSAASTPRQSSQGPPAARHAHDNGSSTAVEKAAEADLPVPRHPSLASDVESQAGTLRYSAADPFNLTSAYMTDQQLDEIKANTSRKRDGGGAGAAAAAEPAGPAGPAGQGAGGGGRGRGVGRFRGYRHRAKRVHGFYRSQNETIERLLKSVEEHRADARADAEEEGLKHRIAVYGSFAANLLLAVLQIYAAVSSGSLSLFTTMADAIFDPLSNVTLILSNRAIRRVDPNRFPSGKARLETVGNIVFCFLMTAVSFILIAFSARELAEGGDQRVKAFHLPSVIAVCVAFATKLVLFLYCWGLKDKYSQINILWQDHRNDLLINGFGILTSVGGAQLAWWIDPAGAVAISALIAAIWLSTAFAEFLLLVGVVAGVEAQQLITYVCLTHEPRAAIAAIDTVRAYHAGPRLIAEVDLVMDPRASLRATHDVAEALQCKLEALPDVERAYVHVDYETTHKPEHAYKKDL